MAVDFNASNIVFPGSEQAERLKDGFSLSHSVKDMMGLDEPTRIALTGVNKALDKIPGGSERTYSRVAESLARNSLLVPARYSVKRDSKFISLGETQQPHAARSNENVNDDVRKWYIKFFDELDVGQCTRASGQLRGWPQGAVSQLCVTDELFSRARDGKAQVTVGFLRFPTRDQPNFTLYKIDIEAWSATKTVESATEREWGVSCETRSQVFAPQLQVIGKLKPETRERALQTADAFILDA